VEHLKGEINVISENSNLSDFGERYGVQLQGPTAYFSAASTSTTLLASVAPHHQHGQPLLSRAFTTDRQTDLVGS
jgi:hypothetical protein